MPDLHLWEIDHPYYGSDSSPNGCETFAELREAIDDLQEGPNHVYRWDWIDWSQPQHDDTFNDGEDRSGQEFAVFLVCPSKSATINFTCPITHDDEPEVLAWLRSDRVAGALQRLWEPILDETEASRG